MDRLVSQARGYDFADLAPVCEDLHWLPVTSCSLVCLACLCGSHCLSVCPPVSVMHSVNLATRNLRTHRSSSRWSMLSLLRTVLYRKGKQSAAQSSRAASSRRSSCLLRSPCLWSSNKKADTLSAVDKPWSNARRRFVFVRQANRKKRCSEAPIARPPVCRTLEQSGIRDSNFRVLAPGRESKWSWIFDLQKVYIEHLTPGELIREIR